MKEFDQPHSALSRPAGQDILVGLLILTPQHTQKSAIHGLFPSSKDQRWTHTLSFLELLNNLITWPSDRSSIIPSIISSTGGATSQEATGVHLLVTEQDFADLALPVQALAQSVLNATWNIKELTAVLARISKELEQWPANRANEEKNQIEKAWEMVLEKGMKSASDLVLLGFSEVEVSVDLFFSSFALHV